MKKLCSVLTAAALLLAVVGLFAACGSKPAEAKTLDLPGILSEIAMKVENMPKETVDLETDEDLEDYYGLDPALIRSFAIRQNASGFEDEIVLIEANDEASARSVADTLEQYRQDRMNEMRDYSPDMFTLLSKTTVDVHGRYVTMFVSAEADAMKAIFNDHLTND